MTAIRNCGLLIVLCFFLTQITFGQTASSQASEILETSQQKLESIQDFSANVSYFIANPNMPKAIPKTGTVKYKDGKYALALTDQEIYCDLTSMWIYLKNDGEVEVLDYDAEEGQTVESIFSLYKANTQAKLVGTELVKGRKCHKIFLTNQDESLDYNEANVWIDTETMLLAKAELIDRKQTTTTFEFFNIKTDLGLSDADFQLTKSQVPNNVIWFDDRE